MREDSIMKVKRLCRGQYQIQCEGNLWRVWRGMNKRWYGTCDSLPGKTIDAPTLDTVKYDIRMRYYV